MNNDLAVSIVKAIIGDIYGRYGLEQELRSTHPRIQVALYETWIHLVSVELQKAGIVDEVYEPLDLEKMHIVDIVNRIPFYLRD